MKIGPVSLFQRRIIGPANNPYIVRHILFRISMFGIYLHEMRRSDHDRALHDHPWPFMSFILRRGYRELTPYGMLTHKPGRVLFRPATWQHAVVIDGKPAWTLIFVGRRSRRWGFWPEGKWCWWRKYNPDLSICEDEVIHPDEGLRD